jgi:uncharacterized protein YnzC (UPF0291/DUF896 family)
LGFQKIKLLKIVSQNVKNWIKNIKIAPKGDLSVEKMKDIMST